MQTKINDVDEPNQTNIHLKSNNESKTIEGTFDETIEGLPEITAEIR